MSHERTVVLTQDSRRKTRAITAGRVKDLTEEALRKTVRRALASGPARKNARHARGQYAVTSVYSPRIPQGSKINPFTSIPRNPENAGIIIEAPWAEFHEDLERMRWVAFSIAAELRRDFPAYDVKRTMRNAYSGGQNIVRHHFILTKRAASGARLVRSGDNDLDQGYSSALSIETGASNGARAASNNVIARSPQGDEAISATKIASLTTFARNDGVASGARLGIKHERARAVRQFDHFKEIFSRPPLSFMLKAVRSGKKVAAPELKSLFKLDLKKFEGGLLAAMVAALETSGLSVSKPANSQPYYVNLVAGGVVSVEIGNTMGIIRDLETKGKIPRPFLNAIRGTYFIYVARQAALKGTLNISADLVARLKARGISFNSRISQASFANLLRNLYYAIGHSSDRELVADIIRSVLSGARMADERPLRLPSFAESMLGSPDLVLASSETEKRRWRDKFRPLNKEFKAYRNKTLRQLELDMLDESRRLFSQHSLHKSNFSNVVMVVDDGVYFKTFVMLLEAMDQDSDGVLKVFREVLENGLNLRGESEKAFSPFEPSRYWAKKSGLDLEQKIGIAFTLIQPTKDDIQLLISLAQKDAAGRRDFKKDLVQVHQKYARAIQWYLMRTFHYAQAFYLYRGVPKGTYEGAVAEFMDPTYLSFSEEVARKYGKQYDEQADQVVRVRIPIETVVGGKRLDAPFNIGPSSPELIVREGKYEIQTLGARLAVRGEYLHRLRKKNVVLIKMSTEVRVIIDEIDFQQGKVHWSSEINGTQVKGRPLTLEETDRGLDTTPRIIMRLKGLNASNQSASIVFIGPKDSIRSVEIVKANPVARAAEPSFAQHDGVMPSKRNADYFKPGDAVMLAHEGTLLGGPFIAKVHIQNDTSAFFQNGKLYLNGRVLSVRPDRQTIEVGFLADETTINSIRTVISIHYQDLWKWDPVQWESYWNGARMAEGVRAADDKERLMMEGRRLKENPSIAVDHLPSTFYPAEGAAVRMADGPLDYLIRISPEAVSMLNPLILSSGVLASIFWNVWIRESAYGGWMRINTASNVSFELNAMASKSLSSVMISLLLPIAVLIIWVSTADKSVFMTSWPVDSRYRMSLDGMFSSARSFMPTLGWISQRRSALGFWQTRRQSGALPGYGQRSVGDNNPFPQSLPVSPLLPKAPELDRPGSAFLENMVFHGISRDLRSSIVGQSGQPSVYSPGLKYTIPPSGEPRILGARLVRSGDNDLDQGYSSALSIETGASNGARAAGTRTKIDLLGGRGAGKLGNTSAFLASQRSRFLANGNGHPLGARLASLKRPSSKRVHSAAQRTSIVLDPKMVRRFRLALDRIALGTVKVKPLYENFYALLYTSRWKQSQVPSNPLLLTSQMEADIKRFYDSIRDYLHYSTHEKEGVLIIWDFHARPGIGLVLVYQFLIEIEKLGHKNWKVYVDMIKPTGGKQLINPMIDSGILIPIRPLDGRGHGWRIDRKRVSLYVAAVTKLPSVLPYGKISGARLAMNYSIENPSLDKNISFPWIWVGESSPNKWVMAWIMSTGTGGWIFMMIMPSVLEGGYRMESAKSLSWVRRILDSLTANPNSSPFFQPLVAGLTSIPIFLRGRTNLKLTSSSARIRNEDISGKSGVLSVFQYLCRVVERRLDVSLGESWIALQNLSWGLPGFQELQYDINGYSGPAETGFAVVYVLVGRDVFLYIFTLLHTLISNTSKERRQDVQKSRATGTFTPSTVRGARLVRSGDSNREKVNFNSKNPGKAGASNEARAAKVTNNKLSAAARVLAWAALTALPGLFFAFPVYALPLQGLIVPASQTTHQTRAERSPPILFHSSDNNIPSINASKEHVISLKLASPDPGRRFFRPGAHYGIILRFDKLYEDYPDAKDARFSVDFWVNGQIASRAVSKARHAPDNPADGFYMSTNERGDFSVSGKNIRPPGEPDDLKIVFSFDSDGVPLVTPGPVQVEIYEIQPPKKGPLRQGTRMAVTPLSTTNLAALLRRLISDYKFIITLVIDPKLNSYSIPVDEEFLKNVLDEALLNAYSHGKNTQNITVTFAYNTDKTDVLLTIEDDGEAIDLNKVVERAIDEGLITPEQSLTDDEKYRLLFSEGFSTREYKSHGYGLFGISDMFERRLGGSVSITNRPSKGVSLRIKLKAGARLVRSGDNDLDQGYSSALSIETGASNGARAAKVDGVRHKASADSSSSRGARMAGRKSLESSVISPEAKKQTAPLAYDLRPMTNDFAQVGISSIPASAGMTRFSIGARLAQAPAAQQFGVEVRPLAAAAVPVRPILGDSAWHPQVPLESGTVRHNTETRISKHDAVEFTIRAQQATGKQGRFRLGDTEIEVELGKDEEGRKVILIHGVAARSLQVRNYRVFLKPSRKTGQEELTLALSVSELRQAMSQELFSVKNTLVSQDTQTPVLMKLDVNAFKEEDLNSLGLPVLLSQLYLAHKHLNVYFVLEGDGNRIDTITRKAAAINPSAFIFASIESVPESLGQAETITLALVEGDRVLTSTHPGERRFLWQHSDLTKLEVTLLLTSFLARVKNLEAGDKRFGDFLSAFNIARQASGHKPIEAKNAEEFIQVITSQSDKNISFYAYLPKPTAQEYLVNLYQLMKRMAEQSV